MSFDPAAAYWTITAAGGFLVLGVTGFSLRDLIRPPAPLKHAANDRNLFGPLRGVVVGLILALVRVVLMVVSGTVPFSEMSLIVRFVDVWTRFAVFLSLLRVTRLFYFSTPADSESGPEGVAKPKAMAAIASNRALDWAVMLVMALLGMLYWALYLGLVVPPLYPMH